MKPPVLGDLSKGEHRLTSITTVHAAMDERGFFKMKHAVDVQMPHGPVVSFKIIQEIPPQIYETPPPDMWRIEWGDKDSDQAKTPEQLSNWLKAAAFALEVMNDHHQTRNVNVFLSPK